MRRYFNSVVVTLLSVFWVSAVWAVDLDSSNYVVYEKDAGGSAKDLFIVPKETVLILHGDIATPIPFMPDVPGYQVTLYGDGSLGAVSSFGLNGNDLAADSNYTLSGYLLHSGDLSGDGQSDLLLQGAGSESSFIVTDSGAASVYYNFNGDLDHNQFSVRVANSGGSSAADVVVTNSNGGEYSYISEGTTSQGSFTTTGVVYDLVGAVNGSFRVNEQGAATYNIAFMTAAGTAGVVPQVSLNYSSTGGNGIAGMGWSLGGLSAITRCRQTLHQDKNPRPINWSEDDRFCLDGQRLIKVSGSQYGAVGATYKTEFDSFAIVTSEGGSLGHPAHFTVERKDGSVSHYGNTADAKLTAGTSNNTLTWAINRFADSVGNPITFHYYNDADGQRIQSIRYAYGSTSTTSTSLEFDYTSGDRPDPIRGYLGGYAFNNDKRLNAVRSYNDGVLIREYRLEYQTEAVVSTDTVSRLESIIECVGSECLAPTRFDWNTPDLGFATSQHTFEYQGVTYTVDVDTQTTTTFTGKAMGAWKPADINGDGLPDLVWEHISWNSGVHIYYRLHVSLSDGATYTDTGVHIILGETKQGSPRKPRKWTVADYNMDGRQDVLVYVENEPLSVYLSTPQPNGDWQIPSTPSLTVPHISGDTLHTMDVNSDGMVDVVKPTSSGDGLVAYLLEKDPTQAVSSSHYYRYSSTAMPVTIPAGTSSFGQNNVIHIQSSGGAADFNGDGIGDLIVGSGSLTHNNFGGMPFILDTRQQQILTMDKDGNLTSLLDLLISAPPTTGARSFYTNLYTVDINGDGLTDIAYQKGFGQVAQPFSSAWYYRLSTGIGFASEVAIGLTANHSENNLQFADYNRDGRLDLIWHDNTSGQLSIRYWNGTSYGPTNMLKDTNVTSTEYQHLIVDNNGDAISDYVQVKGGTGGFIRVYPSKENGASANGSISRITNGLGAVTNIQYQALGLSDHYERLTIATTTTQQEFCIYGYCGSYPLDAADANGFYTALNGEWALPPASQTLGKTDPILELNGPLYVVTDVSSSAPAVASSAGYDALSSIEYYYGEAKLQAGGRGLLGFERLKTIDPQSGIKTITNYRQDFPFTGSPQSTEVYTSGDQLLSRSTNTWTVKSATLGDFNKSSWLSALSTGGSKALGALQPHLSGSVEESFALNGGGLLSKVITTSTYDDAGNVETINVDTENNAGTRVSRTFTDNKYGNGDTYSKRFGRLSETIVTKTRHNQTPITRKSRFNYHEAGTLKGLLKDEIIEPDHSALTLTTHYDYDAFGNKLKATTSGQGVTDRYSRSVYDAKGRYVDETYNTLEQRTQKVSSRNHYGAPLTVLGLNGHITTFQYDILGREADRSDNTGAWAQTTYSKSGLITGAKYKVTVDVAGGGSSTEYFDVLGRSIAKSQVGFDGLTIWSYTEYDSSGRVKRQSTPQYSNETLHWAENTYDILGRPVSQKAADGLVTDIAYAGLTTTFTVDPTGLNQKKIEQKDAAGLLIKVTDNIDGTISYDYTSNGNLWKTHSSDNPINKTITTEIEYDLLDRKTKMLDPDKGTWFYSYNVFGELVNQYKITSTHRYTSAFSSLATSDYQRTHMIYDDLGRMTTRHDYKESNVLEGTSTWTYDTATNGIGQLAVEQGGGITKTYGYDTLGRAETVLMTDTGSLSALLTTQYDSIGRAFKQTDAVNSGSGTENTYNSYGYLDTVTDLVTSDVLYDVVAMDARGNVTQVIMGDGLTTSRNYDDASGRLLTSTASGISTLHKLTYTWDKLGNMRSRHDQSANDSGNNNHQQSFCYDGLSRLIKTHTGSLSGGCSLTPAQQDQEYDDFGNITRKVGVGTYGYGTVTDGPHAVQSTSDGVTYTYDKTGNMTSDTSGRVLKYRVFDKPYEITKGNNKIEFAYGADRARWKRVDTNTSTNESSTTYYLGGVEKVVKNDGSYDMKRMIGGFAIWTHHFTSVDVETGVDKQYLYKDVLGSVNVITDGVGQFVEGMAFNAWGERVNHTDWTVLLDVMPLFDVESLITTRGFTGHEMLDAVGLIHMNGRIYDPKLGRFLQADPLIQAPGNTQSYNRYSYAMNNPLKYVDPSGYSWKLKDIVKIVVVIVISVVTYGAASAWAVGAYGASCTVMCSMATASMIGGTVGGAAAGFAAGVSMAAFSGASLGDAMKAGVQGAFSGAVFGGIAGAFGNNWNMSRVGANSLAGGVTSKINGGEFKDGLRAALVVSMLTYGNYKMRQSRIKQLQNSGNPRNLNGKSRGFFGDNIKIAGAGEVLDPKTGLRVPCVSLMGGCQGAPVNKAIDTRSSFFGRPYDPGSLPDTINESFAGPHDWLRNATGSYITQPQGSYEILGNGKFLTGFDQAIDSIKNYTLVAPAAPFAISGLIDYSGAYGAFSEEF